MWGSRCGCVMNIVLRIHALDAYTHSPNNVLLIVTWNCHENVSIVQLYILSINLFVAWR